MRRTVVVLALILAAAGLGFATGAEETKPATAAIKPSGSVTIYTSMSRDVIEMLKKDFEAANPGCTINVYRSGTAEVLAKLQAEEAGGAVQAELLSVADMDVFRTMFAKGQIHSYRPANIDKVPKAFQYEGGAYNEVRWSGMVILYNTIAVKTAPASWKDMLKPEYKGKIVLADPQYSGTVLAAIGTILTMPDFGWGFFETFKSNGGRIVKSNGEVGQGVASGEFAMGMISDRDAASRKAEGSPVDYVYPIEGTFVLPQPLAILKNCKNLPLAEAFVDYIYGETAMKNMAGKGYTPVLPGVVASAVDFGSLKIAATDWSYIANNRTAIMDRFSELFR